MKSIYRFIFLIGLCLLVYSGYAQNIRTTIKVQAMDMAKALTKNDFVTFSKYMHPKIIELAGGKEKMKMAMDSAYITMKQFGASFKRILFGVPGDVLAYKNQMQCTVPQKTWMITPMGEMYIETTLIAISLSKGKNWYYIDTNVYKGDKLKTALPDLSPKLVIPAQKPPKFIPPE